MNRDPKKKAYIRRKLKNNFWQELSAEHKAGFKKKWKNASKLEKKIIKAFWINCGKAVLKETKVFQIYKNYF